MATLSSLAANPKNPRTISPEKIEMLKRSLEEFGDLSGIVYNRKTKQLVGGHQRTNLLDKSADITITKKYSKPTRTGTIAEGHILVNGERFVYREVSWDDVKEKAANIAANKGAGDWDLGGLQEWMREIESMGFDLDLTMFDEEERKDLFSVKPGQGDKVEGKCDPDEIPESAPSKVKLGEVWQLGQHRLLCGDSTELENYKRLMGGKKVDLVFTSPPYNANTKQMRKGNAKNLYETYSDDLSSDDYIRFASQVLGNCIAHARQYVFWNVNYNSNSRSEFLKQIIPYIELLDETIAWKKQALPVPYGLTRTWEPIFVFRCHQDQKRIGHANVTEFNYWDINNANANCDQHRAAFPVALPEKAIELVKDCESVLDPFGGSVTTLIAAEQHGKRGFMIELDPKYCDLIIARWEKFSGKKANKAGK